MVKPTPVEDMFEVEGAEPPKAKKPTLRQYLKELGKDAKYPLYSQVEYVWYPGQWDNYSLECEHFRVSIGKNHPLYTPIDKGIVKFTNESLGMLVRVIDGKGTIRLDKTTQYGTWDNLGGAGIKFEADEL